MTEDNKKGDLLPLVKNDPWLEPVSDAVEERHNRYERRLNDIVNRYGSLTSFATAHQFFGFHYDRRRKGWWYREWAPAAHYLALCFVPHVLKYTSEQRQGNLKHWMPRSLFYYANLLNLDYAGALAY